MLEFALRYYCKLLLIKLEEKHNDKIKKNRKEMKKERNRGKIMCNISKKCKMIK